MQKINVGDTVITTTGQRVLIHSTDYQDDRIRGLFGRVQGSTVRVLGNEVAEIIPANDERLDLMALSRTYNFDIQGADSDGAMDITFRNLAEAGAFVGTFNLETVSSITFPDRVFDFNTTTTITITNYTTYFMPR